MTASERTDSVGSESTACAYDVAGNVTSITEHGRVTEYSYDAAFRLTELVEASYIWDTADGDDSDQLQSRTVNGEGGNMTGRGDYVYEYSVTNQNTRVDDGDGGPVCVVEL